MAEPGSGLPWPTPASQSEAERARREDVAVCVGSAGSAGDVLEGHAGDLTDGMETIDAGLDHTAWWVLVADARDPCGEAEAPFAREVTAPAVVQGRVPRIRPLEVLVGFPVAVVVEEIAGLHFRIRAQAGPPVGTLTDRGARTPAHLVDDVARRGDEPVIGDTIAVLVRAVAGLLFRFCSGATDPALLGVAVFFP